MKRLSLILLTTLPLFSLSAHGHQPAGPPTLEELAGKVQVCSTLEIMPALSCLYGGLSAGRNILSITDFTAPPISQGGEAMILSLDGKAIDAQWSKWSAFEIKRGSTVGSLMLETAVRMLPEAPGVLFEVTITNQGAVVENTVVSIAESALVRRFATTWEWAPPRPAANDPDTKKNDHQCTITPKKELTCKDTKSSALSVLIFDPKPDSIVDPSSAQWPLSLNPGQKTVLRGILAFKKDGEDTALQAQAKEFMKDFSTHFASSRNEWQHRFNAAFTPANDRYSGCLPLLDTLDPPLRRIYYGSALSFLCMERSCFSTTYPRVFVTCSPRFAPTLTYFWDTQFYATLWARLDPAQLKAQLLLFLAADIHAYNAFDFLTLKGVGRWYSANDYAIFHLLWTYMRVNDDWAFLGERVGDHTILEHMERLALHWKTLVKTPGGLADYGTKDNLLETVPTYTNQVPSFNASNVWMMRTLAKCYAKRGDAKRAKYLRHDADQLAREVLKLYKPENGWWYCRMPDGTLKEVRSIVDFITIATCMKEDLSHDIRNRMMDNVERELWTGQWLRALSIEDPSAKETLSRPEIMATLNAGWPGDSLRADHGFTGSYAAWPALSIEAFSIMGRKNRALEMLRCVEPVLDEGPFGQSHYIAGPTRPVRKALNGGQDYFEGGGGAFADVILRHFSNDNH